MENLERVRAATPTPDDVGQKWLYWDVPTRTFRAVELAVVPAVNSKRVKVQHLDSAKNGLPEWVPAGRCRVPWALRDGYVAQQKRWARLYELGPATGIADIAAQVLFFLLPEVVAKLYYNGTGAILEVHDLSRLASRTGLPADEILRHPDAFREDGKWYVPWPKTCEVIGALGRRNRSRLIEWLIKDDESDRQQTIEALESAEYVVFCTREALAKQVAAMLDEGNARLDERRQLIFSWLGDDVDEEFRQYAALLRAYRDLVVAATAALDPVRQVRTKRAALVRANLVAALTVAPTYYPAYPH